MAGAGKQAVIERQAVTLTRKYAAFHVTDNASAEAAAGALRRVKAIRVGWAHFMDPQIAEARGRLDGKRETKAKLDGQLEVLERYLKEEVYRHSKRLDVKEEKEQVRVEVRAEKQAERDREEQVQLLKKSGKHAEAVQLSKRPLIVAPSVARVDRPALGGIGIGELWDFRITEPAALPREYLMPNDVAIRKVVRAMKDRTKIAGIEVFARGAVSVEAGAV